MKFRVGREELGDAVAFVSRALPARPVVPLLSGMLLDAAADGLTLSCFDYEISARVTVPAEVFEPGTALVPGKLLAEITRSLPASPAEFAAEADVVTLICGRAEFGLVCLAAEDYPALPEPPAPVGVADGGPLAAAVLQVASSASRDDTLPMLTAICVDVSGPVLTLAATDRYRMAASELRFAPAEPDVRAVALVPARILVEAARAMTAGVPVTMAFGADSAAGGQPHPAEGMISLDSGDRRLTTRLIAGDFIKYRARFGSEFGCRADLPAGPTIEAVRRAALVAERGSPVRLSFRPDQVVIEAHTEGRARAAETVPAVFSGDEPVISFNPHYLLDGLVAAAAAGSASADPARQAGGAGRAADSSEVPEGADAAGRIRIEFNTPAKPALITWVDADGRQPMVAAGTVAVPAFRYLVVPLRLPERG